MTVYIFHDRNTKPLALKNKWGENTILEGNIVQKAPILHHTKQKHFLITRSQGGKVTIHNLNLFVSKNRLLILKFAFKHVLFYIQFL